MLGIKVSTISCLLLINLLFNSNSVLAQQPVSLYLLSIGSADYDKNFNHFEKGFPGWPQVPAAANSARQMVKLLRSPQTVYIDTLISRPSRLLTRASIMAAVARVTSRAKTEKRPNPLVVFYFCGHGVSDAIAWSHLMMPGDFHSNLNGQNLLINKNVSVVRTSEVYELFEKSDVPFAMMLDCCYEIASKADWEMMQANRKVIAKRFQEAMVKGMKGNISSMVDKQMRSYDSIKAVIEQNDLKEKAERLKRGEEEPEVDVSGTDSEDDEDEDYINNPKKIKKILLDSARVEFANMGNIDTLATYARAESALKSVYPVVFSAKPGEFAQPKPFPGANAKYLVGPLCRRTSLALSQHRSHPVTIDSLISALISTSLDKETKAVTSWQREECEFKNLRVK